MICGQCSVVEEVSFSLSLSLSLCAGIGPDLLANCFLLETAGKASKRAENEPLFAKYNLAFSVSLGAGVVFGSTSHKGNTQEDVFCPALGISRFTQKTSK